MEKYRNIDGDSNVEAYEIGFDYISVKFWGTEKVYVYTYASAGRQNVEYAKQLAKRGTGLNSYINTHMKYLYQR